METILGQAVVRRAAVGGGCIGSAERVTLAGGRTVFVKTVPDPPGDMVTAEARGLRWLAAAGALPVAEVLAADAGTLVLAWIEPGPATPAAADALGRGLAALHLAGADAYGAPWPGVVGPLPMSNEPAPDWPTFWADRRLLPYADLAAGRGGLDRSDLVAVEEVARHCAELAGPPEPPARLHGDLWSGNLHWAADGRCHLIDPAAHGGHRETDLAMLALFGAPHLDRILGAYAGAAAAAGHPLADGWRDRVPLHQLWPLLVHAALFGGGYGAQAGRAARAALRRR